MQECPFCAEHIQDVAVKCKYCGEFLEETNLRTAPDNSGIKVSVFPDGEGMHSAMAALGGKFTACSEKVMPFTYTSYTVKWG